MRMGARRAYPFAAATRAFTRLVPVALVLATLLGSAGAGARPVAPTWRLRAPLPLGPGPTSHAVSYPGVLGWSSIGSGPVLSLYGGEALAAWAGPDGEVLASLGRLPGGAWQPAGVPSPLHAVGELTGEGTPEIVPAQDGLGDALLGWASELANNVGGGLQTWEIASSYRAAGAPAWQAATTLSNVTRFFSQRDTAPSVGFNPSGDGFAVWAVPGGPVMSNVMPAGTGTWQPPVPVAPPAVYAVGLPLLAVDGAGDEAAAWVTADPHNRPLLVASTRTADGSWAAPVTLGRASEPKLVALPGRAALLVWREAALAGAVAPLYSATVDLARGRWQRPRVLAGAAGESLGGVAIGARGRTLAWWTDESSRQSPQPVLTLRALAGSGGRHWSRPATLAAWRKQPFSLPAGPFPSCVEDLAPTAGFDAREEAILVWGQACRSIFAALLPPHGAQWSTRRDLGRVIGRRVGPVFGVLPRGDLAALWLEPGPPEGSFGERVPTTVAAAVLERH